MRDNDDSTDLGRAVIRRGIQVLLTYALLLVIAVLAAGTWRWPRLWIYAAVIVGLLIANMLYVAPRNPGVVAARSRVGAGTKTFDKIFTITYSLGQLGMMVVCALDAVRFEWTTLPLWVSGLGLLLMVLANIPIAWAMGENPYLETTVRIQKERGHEVVTTGPYAVVRHPMYVGVGLQHLAVPLVLGSAWGLVVAVALLIMLVIRTGLEDRTLQAELPGYAAYAKRTRFRLVPGVW